MVGTWRFHCWAQAHSVPGQGAKSHKSCSAKKKKEKQNSCRQFPCDSKSFLCEYDISLLVTTLKGAHMIHMAKK